MRICFRNILSFQQASSSEEVKDARSFHIYFDISLESLLPLQTSLVWLIVGLPYYYSAAVQCGVLPDDGVMESPDSKDGTGHRSGVVWVGNLT